MKQSLQSLLKGIIDYAGLFPPAGLPLDTAIHNFAQYRKGQDAWMLSRFIIPASRLQELQEYIEELSTEGEPFDFSVLGRKTETANDFIEDMKSVAECCGRFLEEHNGRVAADVLETRLPAEAVLANDVGMLENLLSDTVQVISQSNGRWKPKYIFYEAPLSESWKKDVPVVMEAIARHNETMGNHSDSYQYAGFKLRCGGVEASMFPTTEQVAYVLTKAREYSLAVKCTAGLHHPVRHYNESVQTKMHGFINLFGGGMLAYMHDLNQEELEQVIREEDPEKFVFEDDVLSWHDLTVSVAEINELRETALISFGSCSFDEPREDLRKLKLI